MEARAFGVKIEKAIHAISRGIRAISMVTLLAMVFFVAADVFGRYVLNKPIKGDLEIQELMMVIIVSLAFGYCTVEKQHVFVELVVQRIKGTSLKIMNIIASLFSVVILALIVWRTTIIGWRELMSPTGKVTMMLGIPVAPFILLAAVGIGLMTLVFLGELIRNINATIAKKV